MRDAPVGREPELQVVAQFLDANADSAQCLVLVGDAGMGKTTVWETGLREAAARGRLTLVTRPTEPEAGMSYAALGDLVDGIDSSVLTTVPEPQLRALEIALHRRDPSGESPDQFAVAAAFVSALRVMSERSPVLIAVDDLQWVDAPSMAPLQFAARRMSGSAVRFLVARRPGTQTQLERSCSAGGVEQLEVGPLSFGATATLLQQRLELIATRRVLRQIHDASHGNPLIALEIGRFIADRGATTTVADLPIASFTEDAFGPRIAKLTPECRAVVLAVALCGTATVDELSSALGSLAVEDALASGLLVPERGRVRAAHPLVSSSARRHASARERRDLHRQMAAVVSDAVVRARHLAQSADGPDDTLADAVARAADQAADGGALLDTQDLGAEAVALTPVDSPHYADRVLALGRWHAMAGDYVAVQQLLEPRLAELPPGRARAWAYLLLGEADTITASVTWFDRTLAESGNDPDVRAAALASKAMHLAVVSVKDISAALTMAEQAIAAAEQVDPTAGATFVGTSAPEALAWARILSGAGVDDLTHSAGRRRDDPRAAEVSVARPAAVRHAFRGEVAAARRTFEHLCHRASERGEFPAVGAAQVQLSELAARCGDAGEAARLLGAFEHSVLDQGLVVDYLGVLGVRLRAVISAVAGRPDDARQFAADVLDADPESTPVWDRLEATRARGLADLFEGSTSTAVEQLSAVWAHTEREGVLDPGAFPVAADLVEALLDAGDTTSAIDVTERLSALSTEQQHPWGLITATRCRAAVHVAAATPDGAWETLSAAAASYGELGLQFDQARTLLYLGRLARRHKKRTDAHRALHDAREIFARNGCTGWAELAAAEQARLGGRRPAEASTALTATESHVAELASRGLSNKEIAAALFMSVHTVEAHLTRVYTKLGLRSRAQLSQALQSGTSEPVTS